MPKLKSILLALTSGLITLACAEAEPVAVGKFKDWSVFTEASGGDTICYSATPATSKSPGSADHGEVWFYVTSWKSGKAKGQPSLKVGYELDAARDAKVKVGRSSWTMFAAGRETFADDADDKNIVSAIKQGADLRVTAASARRTDVSYAFSLNGSTAAIEKAAASCQ
jgi:Invasion associated locus B (IalB) protein